MGGFQRYPANVLVRGVRALKQHMPSFTLAAQSSSWTSLNPISPQTENVLFASRVRVGTSRHPLVRNRTASSSSLTPPPLAPLFHSQSGISDLLEPEVPIPIEPVTPGFPPILPPEITEPSPGPEINPVPPPDLPLPVPPLTNPDIVPEIPLPEPPEMVPPFEPEIPAPRHHPLPEIPNPPDKELPRQEPEQPGEAGDIPAEIALE